MKLKWVSLFQLITKILSIFSSLKIVNIEEVGCGGYHNFRINFELRYPRKKYSGQFHQRFMSSFCANILSQKKSNLSLSTEKLLRRLSYKKGVRKMLVKLLPSQKKINEHNYERRKRKKSKSNKKLHEVPYARGKGSEVDMTGSCEEFLPNLKNHTLTTKWKCKNKIQANK